MPRIVFPLILLVAAVVAQSPALGHSFRGDDYLHLYQIEDLGFWRFLLTPHGGHVLPTAYTVFYLCRVLFDLNANGYYALAIATHALNVYLLYRIVETSTRKPTIALVAAFIWGTSGLNQGSIGWYSVYGHIFAGTWTLLFLYGVARVASGDRALTRATPWLWFGYMLAAATSFGAGIPVAMLSGPLLYLFLPDTPGRFRAMRILCALLIVVPVLFLSVHWMHYLLFVSDAAGSAAGKTLATQIAGMTPSSWLEIISMFSMLLSYGTASLVFGPLLPLFGLSVLRSAWVAYGFTAAMLLALGCTVRRIDLSVRPQAIGLLLFAAGSYGIIALARASIYDVHGYPMMHAASETRYHYLAPALLALFLAMLAAEFDRPVVKPWRWIATIAATLLLGANWTASRNINDALSADSGALFASTVDSIESKIHAQAEGSKVVIQNKPFAGAGWGHESIPGLAAVFLIHFPENLVDGRRVYFSEKDPDRLAYWRRVGGQRLRDLLIAPRRDASARGRKDGRRGAIGVRRAKHLD